MEWFIAAVVIVVLGVAAVAAAGGMGEMSTEPVKDVYRQDLPPEDTRPLDASDLEALRFGVTVRGYAMGQVDEILERLGREIAERDARIAELSAQLPPSAPTSSVASSDSGKDTTADDPPALERP